MVVTMALLPVDVRPAGRERRADRGESREVDHGVRADASGHSRAQVRGVVLARCGAERGIGRRRARDSRSPDARPLGESCEVAPDEPVDAGDRDGPTSCGLAKADVSANVVRDHQAHQSGEVDLASSSRARCSAFAGSPSRMSTSAGRRNAGFCVTYGRQSSMPTSANASVRNSSIEWVSPGGEHEVVGLVVLQHLPHALARSRPRSPSRAWATGRRARCAACSPSCDAGDRVGDLAGHELEAAPLALVVEQDAARDEHAVALAVVLGDPMPVELGDAVGAARVEQRVLVVARAGPVVVEAAEHLRRRRLVDAGALGAARDAAPPRAGSARPSPVTSAVSVGFLNE